MGRDPCSFVFTPGPYLRILKGFANPTSHPLPPTRCCSVIYFVECSVFPLRSIITISPARRPSPVDHGVEMYSGTLGASLHRAIFIRRFLSVFQAHRQLILSLRIVWFWRMQGGRRRSDFLKVSFFFVFFRGILYGEVRENLTILILEKESLAEILS